MLQGRAFVGALLGAFVLVVGTSAVLGAPAEQATPSLLLVAGQGDGVVWMNGFVPNRLAVAEGTSVTWRIDSDEVHSITFLAGEPLPLRNFPQPEDPSRPRILNPKFYEATPPAGPYDGSSFISSGLISRGETFTVTFSKSGIYPFVCVTHEPMTGVLEVLPPGSPGITTQPEADQAIATHFPEVHAAQIAEIMATRNRATRINGPGDTSIWFVRAGTDWRGGHLDISAFLPDTLAVKQGDMVVWTTDHLVPHTVTFLAPGQARPPDALLMWPDGTLVEPGVPPSDPSMTPRLVQGPSRLPARPSPVYDGVSYFNSGQFGNNFPPGPSYALTFGVPGTFEYLCMLHEAQSMFGKIIVEPRE